MTDNDSFDEPLLELPKTRLRVLNGELQRTNDAGTMVLRLPLTSIRSVEFSRPFNPFGLVFLGAAAALVAIAALVSPYTWLSVLLYVGALIPAFLGFFGIRQDRIVVRTGDGMIKFDCPEMTEDVSCFAASLQEMLGNNRDWVDERRR